MKKWHIGLVILVVIIAIAIFFFARITTLYSARVMAAEAGGAVGIAPYTDRIDFGDVPQGKAISKTVVLTNQGESDNTIRVFTLGSIGSLIEVEPSTSFEIEAGQTLDVNFKLTMPASAPVGTKFSGRIIIIFLPW